MNQTNLSFKAFILRLITYTLQQRKRVFWERKPETKAFDLVLVGIIGHCHTFSILCQPTRARAACVPFLATASAYSWRVSSTKKVTTLGKSVCHRSHRPAEGVSEQCHATFGAPALVCWHARRVRSSRQDVGFGTASTSAACVGASAAGARRARC